VRIGVIGDGGWGTALALLLRENGHSVRLWGAFPDYVEEVRRSRENVRFLPGVPLPADLSLTSDPADLVEGASLVVSVVPTPYLRVVARRFAPLLSPGTPLVSATKGLEKDTLARPTQILGEVLGESRPCAVLSGPSHAEEVSRGVPTAVVAGCPDGAVRTRVQEVFSNERFRVYGSSDAVGVELGGALKNVIALAAGICDGLQMGDNPKAALVTRGVVEIARLGSTLGARRETFFGLSGVGDLIVTAYSRHSRNRSVGERIARGEALESILSSSAMVPEGVFTTRALGERDAGVDLPIVSELYGVLFRRRDPREAVIRLMTRDLKEEVEG
jgi:glycerol-3-phosphate dehydrogenase (NAD(P)+)